MVDERIVKCREVMKEHRDRFAVFCAGKYKEHYLSKGFFDSKGRIIKIHVEDLKSMDGIELFNCIRMVLESYLEKEVKDNRLPLEGDLMYRLIRFMYSTIHGGIDSAAREDDTIMLKYCQPFLEKYGKWYQKLARAVAYGILDLLNDDMEVKEIV